MTSVRLPGGVFEVGVPDEGEEADHAELVHHHVRRDVRHQPWGALVRLVHGPFILRHVLHTL